MNSEQFEILIDKLEEIRCGIIDIESNISTMNHNRKKAIIRCDRCGTALDGDYHFCPSCGKEIG